MIQRDAKYVVMGLLDADSLAFAIGEEIRELGGQVIYTVQSERPPGVEDSQLIQVDYNAMRPPHLK